LSSDKRDADRVQVLGDLHGEVMIFQHIAIKEISTSGAQIETTFPLQLDSLHDLRLTLGDRSVVIVRLSFVVVGNLPAVEVFRQFAWVQAVSRLLMPRFKDVNNRQHHTARP
jgi:hypothetical protein